MASFFSNSNLSVLAIPAYHILTLAPHAVAINMVSGGDMTKHDNRNPRAVQFKQNAQKRLSPEKFATYERLEAASANGFENMPLFIASIVLGNLAGLHKVEGKDGLNWFAGAFLALRALYNVVYWSNDNQAKSSVRSMLYFVGTALCWRVLVKSAQRLV